LRSPASAAGDLAQGYDDHLRKLFGGGKPLSVVVGAFKQERLLAIARGSIL
jgi:hypothetical protein